MQIYIHILNLWAIIKLSSLFLWPPCISVLLIARNSSAVQMLLIYEIILSLKHLRTVHAFSLVCSAFSGRSRHAMMPVFAMMSSFLYMIIFHVVALHPLYHCLAQVLVPSTLPSKTVCRRDSLLNIWPNQFFVFVRWCSSSFCFHRPCPKPLDWISVQSNSDGI